MLKKLVMPALLAAALLWLMFFADREKPAQMQTLAMGTLVDMTVLGLGGQTNHQALQQAVSQLRVLEQQWHPDKQAENGNSLLANMNTQLALQKPQQVPPALAAGFAAAAEYSHQSDGLFDPAVGALVKLWGFHSDAETRLQPPSAVDIDASKTPLRFDQLLQAGQIQGRAGMRLDFGAFAKGLLLQQIAGDLRSQYPKVSFLLNGGGDLVAAGQRPERPWRIAVRHPRQQHKYLATIELLDGEAAFTSGDYERYFDAETSAGEAQHFHHILDPRTGWPAQGTQSLTVLHADGGLADAASTALFVAADNWPTVAAAMGISAVLRVAADGAIEWTPAMAARAVITADADGVMPQVRLRELP